MYIFLEIIMYVVIIVALMNLGIFTVIWMSGKFKLLQLFMLKGFLSSVFPVCTHRICIYSDENKKFFSSRRKSECKSA